jgi:uncharacterized membrane protein YeaQ/YmgE (transglycosylase-associated protein family)
MGWIVLIIGGAIVGALARLIIPGKQPMGMLITVVLGILGALIGGYVGARVAPNSKLMYWVLAVVAAIGLTFVYGAVTRKRIT